MNSSPDSDSNAPASSSPPADRVTTNLEQCAKPNLWKEYFVDAEPQMDQQWEERIWPIIQGFDFSNTVEVAPGGGRNSAKLIEHAGSLTLIDYNEYCIELCQERFAEHPKRDSMQFFVNDGRSLEVIESETVTAIYSWDSFVTSTRRSSTITSASLAACLLPAGRSSCTTRTSAAMRLAFGTAPTGART